MPGDWEANERAEVVARARAAFRTLTEQAAALQAETLATAGTAARDRYGQFCTQAENGLQTLRLIRVEMTAAGCDAAALAKVDAIIASGATLCTARRKIHVANDFVVTLKPKV